MPKDFDYYVNIEIKPVWRKPIESQLEGSRRYLEGSRRYQIEMYYHSWGRKMSDILREMLNATTNIEFP